MIKQIITASALALTVAFTGSAIAGSHGGKLAVGITPSMQKYSGNVTIQRNQDQNNVVNPAFAKTSRKCPPFCIQPMNLAPGVATIGEVEVIEYIKKMEEGANVLVVDSRTPDWVGRGTIPGAKNLPWTKLNPAKGADPISISEIMIGEFGAKEVEGLWDFSSAKTLVMFCNGMWCGQSPNNIKNLLKFGYPADKIKWYRGGMQDWEILGLSTQK